MMADKRADIKLLEKLFKFSATSLLNSLLAELRASGYYAESLEIKIVNLDPDLGRPGVEASGVEVSIRSRCA